ncbi:hypothetical protein SK128_016257, partial [Halocaridina rubra]
NESCVESPDISRDGDDHLSSEKTSSLAIETLIAETEASEIILPNGIETDGKASILPTSFTTTFVTTTEQHAQIGGIADSTALLTSDIDVEESLFKKSHNESSQILKCNK